MFFLRKYFPYVIILLNLFGTLALENRIGIYILYPTQIIIGVSSLFYYLKHYKSLHLKYPYISFLYVVMLFYVLVGFIKQFFILSGIFPFVRMSISMAFLSIGSYFFIADRVILTRILKLWMKWVPVLFVVFYFILYQSQYGSYFHFYSLFVLLFPLLILQKKLIIVIISVFLLTSGIIQRMDIISILLPILIALAYSSGLLKNKYVFLWLNKAIIAIPIVFFLLALTTSFNVLAIDKYIGDYSLDSGDKLNVDTRSFLYQESYESAKKNNYILWGRTPLYGYDSYWQMGYGSLISDSYKPVNGVCQRGSEVFIVNIFTWCGVIGVIFFFIFFYKVSHRAILSSNNVYMKVLGLYVSCFWVIDWFGNNMWGLNMSYILLFIIVGMIYSPFYMKMTNREFEIYFREILK